MRRICVLIVCLFLSLFMWEAKAAGWCEVLLSYQWNQESATAPLSNSADLQAGGGRWSRETQTQPVPGRTDCEDINVTMKLLEGMVKAAGVSCAAEFPSWDQAGYVMVPGAVYNGNRFDVLPQGYFKYDPGRLLVLDHVTANPESDFLSIHNPTKFDTDVKFLVENNSAASCSTGVRTLKNANTPAIPAGGMDDMSSTVISKCKSHQAASNP